MKVLVNGGVNLSELDGWWAEAYKPEVGWALGDGNEHGNDPGWDAIEANALYDLLENEMIPEFYNREKTGIPRKWVERIRESMAVLTPRFSANRTVREYTERHYIPAAQLYLERASKKGVIGKKLVDWQHDLKLKWSSIRFGEVKVETKEQSHEFEVHVYLDNVDPDSIRVELYADGTNGSSPVIQEMRHTSQPAEITKGYIYAGQVSALRPATDYTARVIPYCKGVAVPLEAAQILWQR
jgi:starch phosphorylase